MYLQKVYIYLTLSRPGEGGDSARAALNLNNFSNIYVHPMKLQDFLGNLSGKKLTSCQLTMAINFCQAVFTENGNLL